LLGARLGRRDALGGAESQAGIQISLTGETDHCIFHFATFEEKKSRYIADPKPGGKNQTALRIDSGNLDVLALFFRDLIQYWGDHAARGAPGSGKID